MYHDVCLHAVAVTAGLLLPAALPSVTNAHRPTRSMLNRKLDSGQPVGHELEPANDSPARLCVESGTSNTPPVAVVMVEGQCMMTFMRAPISSLNAFTSVSSNF
jgi:hypothetical protein